MRSKKKLPEISMGKYGKSEIPHPLFSQKELAYVQTTKA
jgi:hypothetical protein